MDRTVFKRSLHAGVGLALGLVLCCPFPLAAAETPPAPEPGTLVVFAGTGTPGFSGNNGPATQARLAQVTGLAFDAGGNLYIAERSNQRVRRVGLDGIITTFAGTGTAGFSGDNGPARQARLNGPIYLAFDAAGNLFITEVDGHRVRKVSPDGIITTVAGGGKPASGIGDGGPALAARLYFPHGVAVDREGNLFIADWGNSDLPVRPRVRKVSPDGTITTFAGTGKQGYSGDGGPATQADLGQPVGLAIDSMGNLYIAEGIGFGGPGSRVRKVSPEGIITTVAGIGPSGFSGDGGLATEARLNWPTGVAVDSAGNLFIGEFFGHRVRKVGPDGIINTVAGGGTALPSAEGAPATAVALGFPTDITVDAVGNLYITDSTLLSGLGYGNKRDWVFKVYGVAAPGLIGGMPFPQPNP
jgi:hypothetical protein